MFERRPEQRKYMTQKARRHAESGTIVSKYSKTQEAREKKTGSTNGYTLLTWNYAQVEFPVYLLDTLDIILNGRR